MKWIVALCVTSLLAAGTFGVAACAGSSKAAPPAVTPAAAPAAAPQPNPPPAATPPAPATPPPAATPPPVTTTPPAAPPPGGASPAEPAGGEAMNAAGRGGRGTPPPPPPPPPAVMPKPVEPIVSACAASQRPGRRRGAGRVEHADALDDAAEGPHARRDALRPGVLGQPRHPGQLQRLRHLRHLQSVQAGAHANVSVSGVAERRVGLQKPAVHVL